MAHNPNCDGSHCRDDTGPVKLYPLGTEPLHGNMILCRACWAAENQHRFNQGQETGEPQNWPQMDWNSAKHYAG